MARTSKRQETLNEIYVFLRKEPETIEEALRKDQALCEAGLAGTQTTAEDYSYCPTCNRVRWHEQCPTCDEQEVQA